MDRTLQFVLVLVVVVLAGFLVPLLMQLNRTAKAMQALAESAKEDLSKMSGDVHEVRLHIERLAALTERSLELPATASAMASSVIRSLAGSSSLWTTALVTALKFGLDFFRRPREAAPCKEAKNE
jgi:hypothetical protein